MDLSHILNKSKQFISVYGIIILIAVVGFFLYQWGVNVGKRKSVANAVQINRERINTLNDSVQFFKKENKKLINELKIYTLEVEKRTKTLDYELHKIIEGINSSNISDQELYSFIAKWERLVTDVEKSNRKTR